MKSSRARCAAPPSSPPAQGAIQRRARQPSLRRWLGALPLPLLAALTLILPLIGASLGLAVVMVAWLARDSGRFERELIDIYGADSPELADHENRAARYTS